MLAECPQLPTAPPWITKPLVLTGAATGTALTAAAIAAARARANLTNAARLLGVVTKTLRLAAEAGDIQSIHPLPDSPWIFGRAELGHPAAQRLAHRARQNPKYPTGSHPDQQNLLPSTA